MTGSVQEVQRSDLGSIDDSFSAEEYIRTTFKDYSFADLIKTVEQLEADIQQGKERINESAGKKCECSSSV